MDYSPWPRCIPVHSDPQGIQQLCHSFSFPDILRLKITKFTYLLAQGSVLTAADPRKWNFGSLLLTPFSVKQVLRHPSVTQKSKHGPTLDIRLNKKTQGAPLAVQY